MEYQRKYVTSQNTTPINLTLNNSLADIKESTISHTSMPFNTYIQQKSSEALSKLVPPLAERSKYGGPPISSNRDYGNFSDSMRIDELLKNMRHLKSKMFN